MSDHDQQPLHMKSSRQCIPLSWPLFVGQPDYAQEFSDPSIDLKGNNDGQVVSEAKQQRNIVRLSVYPVVYVHAIYQSNRLISDNWANTETLSAYFGRQIKEERD